MLVAHTLAASVVGRFYVVQMHVAPSVVGQHQAGGKAGVGGAFGHLAGNVMAAVASEPVTAAAIPWRNVQGVGGVIGVVPWEVPEKVEAGRPRSDSAPGCFGLRWVIEGEVWSGWEEHCPSDSSGALAGGFAAISRGGSIVQPGGIEQRLGCVERAPFVEDKALGAPR